MIESLGRRLRVVLGRAPTAPLPTVSELAPVLPPEVEFIGYAEDCLLRGHVRLAATRLSDLLNAHDEYQLIDVVVEGLIDGVAIEVKEVLVSRDELLLVHATGPRGDRARRQRTRQHPLALQAGPFHVRGYLHALPGSDPVESFRRRKPMVPLTEAWVEYESGGVRQRRRVPSLVVNRHQVDWVGEAPDEEAELPDLPIAIDPSPLLKDFTGQIRMARE